MMHVTTLKSWDLQKNNTYYESGSLTIEGFIHASPFHYFWRVAPNFKDVSEELVILILDESKIEAEVRYEAFETDGRAYPHIYGKLNTSSVIKVIPYLKDGEGNWIKNPELSHIKDE